MPTLEHTRVYQIFSTLMMSAVLVICAATKESNKASTGDIRITARHDSWRSMQVAHEGWQVEVGFLVQKSIMTAPETSNFVKAAGSLGEQLR